MSSIELSTIRFSSHIGLDGSLQQDDSVQSVSPREQNGTTYSQQVDCQVVTSPVNPSCWKSMRQIASRTAQCVKNNWGAIASTAGLMTAGAGAVQLVINGINTSFFGAFQALPIKITILVGAALLFYGIDVITELPLTRKPIESHLDQKSITVIEGDLTQENDPAPIAFKDVDSFSARRKRFQEWKSSYLKMSHLDRIRSIYLYCKYPGSILSHLLIFTCVRGGINPTFTEIGTVGAGALGGVWLRYLQNEFQPKFVHLPSRIISCFSQPKEVKSCRSEKSRSLKERSVSIFKDLKEFVRNYPLQLAAAALSSGALGVLINGVFYNPGLITPLQEIEGLTASLLELSVIFTARPFLGPLFYKITKCTRPLMPLSVFAAICTYGSFPFWPDVVNFGIKMAAFAGIGMCLGLEDALFAHHVIELEKWPVKYPFWKLPFTSAMVRLSPIGSPWVWALTAAAFGQAEPQNFNGTAGFLLCLMSYQYITTFPEHRLAKLIERSMISGGVIGGVFAVNGTTGVDVTSLLGLPWMAVCCYPVLQKQRNLIDRNIVKLAPPPAPVLAF